MQTTSTNTQNDLLQVFYFEDNEIGVIMIDGEPYFPATECAKALGYAKPRNAILEHCPHALKQGVGVKTGVKADGTPAMQMIKKSYIPESDLYRLIMRSKLPSAQRFETWVVETVLPSIRKTGSFSAQPEEELSPLLQFLISVERRQNKHEAQLAALDTRVTGIRNVVALNPDNWRRDANRIINTISAQNGSLANAGAIRGESYDHLQNRCSVNLNARLNHMKQRALEAGICQSRIDQMNRMDVIESDKKLKECYIAIVKEMAIQYGIAESLAL